MEASWPSRTAAADSPAARDVGRDHLEKAPKMRGSIDRVGGSR
jgi:hypothetical protein